MSLKTERPAAPRGLPILMYHSIADRSLATAIGVDTFRMQMEVAQELDYTVIDLADVAAWLSGKRALPEQALAITFDDAFQDFAENAFPVLERLSMPSTVFVPTELVGRHEAWNGADTAPRALMDWATLRDLAGRGVSFGGHGLSHRDLTTLGPEEMSREVRGCRDRLIEELSQPVTAFAPPYGHANEEVWRVIAAHYAVSVGVRLEAARYSSPRYDLPRIEMHYFRERPQWQAYLEGRRDAYLRLRRAARGARMAVNRATGG